MTVYLLLCIHGTPNPRSPVRPVEGGRIAARFKSVLLSAMNKFRGTPVRRASECVRIRWW